MAAKKKLTKKAMKKTKGGAAVDCILNKVEGETTESSAQRSRVTSLTVTFSGQT